MTFELLLESLHHSHHVSVESTGTEKKADIIQSREESLTGITGGKGVHPLGQSWALE